MPGWEKPFCRWLSIGEDIIEGGQRGEAAGLAMGPRILLDGENIIHNAEGAASSMTTSEKGLTVFKG